MSKDYRMFSMPSAQCYVAIDELKECPGEYMITLVSYSTQVIHIYYDKDMGGCYVMDCTGTYSNTTARHINRFTTEFCGSSEYFMCKKYAGENYVLNPETGNVYTLDYRYVHSVVNKYLTMGRWKRNY